MLGFCPDGPNCELQHVKSLLQPSDLKLSILANFPLQEDWTDGKMHMRSGDNLGFGGN